MSKYHTNQTVHFETATLLVQNLNKQLEFYKEILGFEILEQSENRVSLTANGKTPILILETNDQVTDPKSTQGLYHTAYLLPNEHALSLVLRRLVTYKYPLTGASDHGVSHALYLDDPEDNGIELYFDLDDKLWPRKNGNIDMYTHGLDVYALLDVSTGESVQPMDKDTIIGHLHFHVLRLAEAKNFYSDILGFDVILNYYGQALFVSSAGYHHHLGLNTWNPGAPLKDENTPGLKGYVISIPNKEFESLKERLTQNNITLKTDKELPYIEDILKQTIEFNIK